MPIQLSQEERTKIYEELKYAFNNKTELRHNSSSSKIIKKMDVEYSNFYHQFLSTLHSMCEILYEDRNIRTKKEIFAMIDNKRNHAMEDDEITAAKLWLNGKDIAHELRPVFFRRAFDEDNIEEILDEALKY